MESWHIPFLLAMSFLKPPAHDKSRHIYSIFQLIAEAISTWQWSCYLV